ncbi:glycine-rich extracellular protein 1 isoform X5 [Pogona vitticeps]
MDICYMRGSQQQNGATVSFAICLARGPPQSPLGTVKGVRLRHPMRREGGTWVEHGQGIQDDAASSVPAFCGTQIVRDGTADSFRMASLNLYTLFLFLCLAGISLQGGMKPSRNGQVGLYLPSYMRGVTAMQPGAGLGPAGAKAGRYPFYGTQGLPTGLGYGVPAGYGAGYRGVGYPRAGFPFGVLGHRGKTSKAGYGAGPSAGGYQAIGIQQAYPGGVGAGGYPSNGLQNGDGNGYGAGGNGFPSTGPQPGGYGNGNGARGPYGTPLEGPAGDPTAAKYGGAGQLPYSGQSQQPEATGLGGDYSARRYGGPQLSFGSQPVRTGLDDNGNGLGYMNGVDSQANGLGAGAYVPLATGQVAGGYGPGQALGGFGGKESKYGMNGFLGNRYRVRCASGKC